MKQRIESSNNGKVKKSLQISETKKPLKPGKIAKIVYRSEGYKSINYLKTFFVKSIFICGLMDLLKSFIFIIRNITHN